MLGPDSRIRSAVRGIDDVIARTESVLVTTAALLMTATVSLDIIQRAFSRPESKLGEKVLSVLSWFGASKTPENQAFMADYVAPAILAVTTFMAGWAVYGASCRRQAKPAQLGIGLGCGLVTLIGAYGLVQGILVWPSRWVCFGLILIGVLAWLIQRVQSLGVAMTALCLAISLVLSFVPVWGGSLWLMGVGFLGFAGWSVYTDSRRWDIALVGLIAVASWYGCKQLPAETITGGMKLGYVWSQEFSLILLAWVAFIGASMATRASRHIQVDALSKVLPGGAQPWARAIGLLISTLFCAYLTFLAYEHIFSKPAGDFWTGEIRPATRLPAWIIILSALVSFGLMTLRFAALSVDAFVDRRLPEREINH